MSYLSMFSLIASQVPFESRSQGQTSLPHKRNLASKNGVE